MLSPQEARDLFGVLRQLVAEGMGIIFISHKLNEVLALADRISVLRRGVKVGETISAEGATRESLAKLMVGRDVDLSGTRRPTSAVGEPVLQITDLTVRDDRDLEVVHDVSLVVNGGEIVALAGVDGNGQTELVQAITGLRKPERGHITIAGTDVTGKSANDAFDAGLGHIPEDRHRHGLVLEFSIAENVVMEDHDKAPVSKLGWINPRVMLERARRLIAGFDVRGGVPETLAGSLSGGNQQKVVIAREVDRGPQLLVAAQPVRGLDIGAVEFVHDQLIAQRDAGRGVLLLSLIHI